MSSVDAERGEERRPAAALGRGQVDGGSDARRPVVDASAAGRGPGRPGRYEVISLPPRLTDSTLTLEAGSASASMISSWRRWQPWTATTSRAGRRRRGAGRAGPPRPVPLRRRPGRSRSAATRPPTGVGVARHTAKFHLDRLVEEGLLDTEFRRLSGRQGPGAGRPTKLYRRSAREVVGDPAGTPLRPGRPAAGDGGRASRRATARRCSTRCTGPPPRSGARSATRPATRPGRGRAATGWSRPPATCWPSTATSRARDGRRGDAGQLPLPRAGAGTTPSWSAA